MNDRPKNSNHPWLLYGWLTVVVISAILLVATLPRMRTAFEESGMAELVKQHIVSQRSGDTPETSHASIVFPIPRADGRSHRFVSYPIKIAGNLPRHEAVEKLLAGPPREALAEGAVTYIPSATSLRGLTVSNQIVFVDFSNGFLEPTEEDPDMDIRSAQVRRTLMANQSIRDVVILVEGVPLERLKNSTTGTGQ
ncbi:MAG: GerMN domain-containing protein [Sphaerochaeta sp.]|nr:GerMN domain-containing protein [Sphaerochaeta sp.]